jgi:hypothetical protein
MKLNKYLNLIKEIKQLKLYLSIIVLSNSYFVFYYFINNELLDLVYHFKTCHFDNLPPNFLLYILPSFFENIEISKFVFITILSFSVLLKFNIVFYIFNEHLIKYNKNILLIFSFLFMFIFSLPSLAIISNQFYLRTFPINVWHNGTIILVMPFAILLFYLIFYKKINIKNIGIVLILILLNLFTKPSFLFVLVPLFSLLILLNVLFEKKIFIKENYYYLLLTIFIGICVFIQYLLLFENNNPNEKNEVIITFILLKWEKIHVVNFFISIFTSFLFPIFYLYFTRYNIAKVDFKVYLSVLLSILIYLFISEKGSRAEHGNFSWQIVCSSFILYLFNFIEYLKNYNLFTKNIKIILNLILLSNLIFGIIYLLRIFLIKEVW